MIYSFLADLLVVFHLVFILYVLDLLPDSLGNSTKKVGRRGRIYRKFHRTIPHPHHLPDRIEPGDPNATGEYRPDRGFQSVYSDSDKKGEKERLRKIHKGVK